MTSIASTPRILTLRAMLSRYRRPVGSVAMLSIALNVLALAGSIYMMLVYDSVLPSHSLPTLFALLGLLVLLYVFQGVFDNLRAQILGDIAASLDRSLTERVQRAIGDDALVGRRIAGDGLGPMRDLESVRNYLCGPGPAALIDLPWIIFYVSLLMLLHVWLGLAALIGGAVLVTLTLISDRVMKAPMAQLGSVSAQRFGAADSNVRHVELFTALGMRERMLQRWAHLNHAFLSTQTSLARSTATLGGISRIGRMLLQSLILTVGAVLVIQGKASGGVIFASSIISGRALAPVDQAIATWRSFAAARLGWARLGTMFANLPADVIAPLALPRPVRDLQVQQLHVAPPGSRQMTLYGIDFLLSAGDGLGVVGPSASGKSTLGRAILGLWRPALGAVRLDGAALDQWDSDRLGHAVGYLPQSVQLIEGTIAENIARFDPAATSEQILAAAQAAGVHDMITALADGYATMVGTDGGNLSAGQQQRLGLARALFGDPFLVVLDEPNSNLDAAGDLALGQAIRDVRTRGGIVVLISHRPSTLASVNLALFLRNGRMQAFGPCDDVMQQILAKPAPAVAEQSGESTIPLRKPAVG